MGLVASCSATARACGCGIGAAGYDAGGGACTFPGALVTPALKCFARVWAFELPAHMVSPLHVFLAHMDGVLVLLLVMMLVVVAVVVVLVSFLWFGGSIASEPCAGVLCF
jgi:hypothetical protein